ncbi:hypothetical protein [Streptomyces sp. cg35]|uniref:hypothetical protein n=1 Tax=Streptomyces sp. cg35 TaxID=3421650 RepID=UPI003D1685E3
MTAVHTIDPSDVVDALRVLGAEYLSTNAPTEADIPYLLGVLSAVTNAHVQSAVERGDEQAETGFVDGVAAALADRTHEGTAYVGHVYRENLARRSELTHREMDRLMPARTSLASAAVDLQGAVALTSRMVAGTPDGVAESYIATQHTMRDARRHLTHFRDEAMRDGTFLTRRAAQEGA